MPTRDYYQEYGPMRRRRLGAPDPQDEPPEPRRRPQRRRTTRRRARLARWLFGALLTIVLVLLALPYAVHVLYLEQALPGVSVQGLPVSGQNRTAISAALAARYDDFLQQPITLVYAGQTWRLSPDDLGLRFDVEQLTAMAMEIGRRGGPLSRLSDLWTLWQTGVDVTPRLVVDQRQMQSYIASLAPAVEHPPRDAALSLAGGEVIGTPGMAGNQILVDATGNDILAALQTLTPQQAPLRTRRLEPDINDDALRAAENYAREMLRDSLVLTHDERTWTWEPDKLAEILRVERSDGRLTVQVDDEQLQRAVERLAQLVDSGSVEPRLRFVNGELDIVEPGASGWQLQQADAVQVISETLFLSKPATRTLALPVEQIDPRITTDSLDELGIRELVGEGRSSFSGSAQYRITNIKAGAARMDGVLIAPDEEFSFNTQLGNVDAENGFVEGYAVIGNRTQLEWGGGVCQDSTTVFRAAFWAGLPITERHAHPFYISWYDQFGYGAYGDGAGMDATIYTGVSDLKFVNDTGHWLLMQAEVDEVNQVLMVQLFGTRPDREVIFDGPYINNEVPAPREPIYVDDPSRPAGTIYQSDVARSGRDITIYRVILQDGVEIKRGTFVTRFKAWPNVFVRGVGG